MKYVDINSMCLKALIGPRWLSQKANHLLYTSWTGKLATASGVSHNSISCVVADISTSYHSKGVGGLKFLYPKTLGALVGGAIDADWAAERF